MSLRGQNPNVPTISVTTAPSGSCGGSQVRYLAPGGVLYTCQSGTWAVSSGGGGSGLPTASTAGQIPVSTGPGTTYTAQTPTAAVTVSFDTAAGTCSLTAGTGSCTASSTCWASPVKPCVAVTHNLNSINTGFNGVTAAGYIFGGATAGSMSYFDALNTLNTSTVAFSVDTAGTMNVWNGQMGPPGPQGPTGTITGDLLATFVTGAGALSAGTVAYGSTPTGCTISSFNISVSPADTATFDVWVAGDGTTVATVANTITASALPAISTGSFLASTTLTGWSTAITAGRSYAIKLTAVGGTASYANLRVICR